MKGFEFKNIADSEVELYINGEIGGNFWTGEGVTFEDFKAQLSEVEGRDLTINISSEGGQVFVGNDIANLIRKRNGNTKCVISSLCASIATQIASACDTVAMNKNGLYMIHLCSGVVAGNKNDLSKQIDLMDKIDNILADTYCEKTGIDKDVILDYMEKESWFSATEALELGFIDSIVENDVKLVACVNSNLLNSFKNTPDELKNLLDKEVTMDDNKEPISNVSTTTIKNELSQEDIRVELRKQLVDGLGVDKYDIWISGSMVYDSFFIYEMWSSTNEEYEYYKATFNRQGDVVTVDVENIEKVERKTVWVTADESEVLVNEKVTIINELTSEKESIQAKYNEVSETVINLNTQISNLQDKADKYDEHILNEKVNEAITYYQDKFEGLNAKAKFESEEVQILIKNSISDMDSKMKLNEMLLNLVPKATKVENKTEKVIKEQVKEVKNLLPNKPKSFEERYGL